ncbi:MAG: sugar transferase [Rickettsiales bacterium]|nr:sugar transferase [Rickettsiales bacterium]
MILKRSFDFFVSLFLLILFLPLMGIISVLIYFKLGLPIFFKQPRSGLNGKLFMMYKFRTMQNKYDQNGQLLSDSKRLTKFGKFLRKYSLDELPELFNVMKGDMSLVGPRPLLMEYLPLYSKQQARRHEVKPGVTGWAQVNGRNSISWQEKLKLDVWYVNNQSFKLDLKIIFITFFKVIKGAGVNTNDGTTMPYFTGEDK